MDTIDPITVENEFVIIIGYHLDTIEPITVQMDEFVKINYKMNAIDQLEWCWMICSIVIRLILYVRMVGDKTIY